MFRAGGVVGGRAGVVARVARRQVIDDQEGGQLVQVPHLHALHALHGHAVLRPRYLHGLVAAYDGAGLVDALPEGQVAAECEDAQLWRHCDNVALREAAQSALVISLTLMASSRSAEAACMNRLKL